MRSARFGFREEPEKKEEHRGSVMPEHLSSIDPLFRDAEAAGFEPETPDQAEAMREKVGTC